MSIKILIADDDRILRELVCDIIRKEGYVPLEACNGQEAIDKFFECNEIDLIILDVMMPIYDGWEVLKEIRTYSDVPIIMLTALSDEKNEVHGLKKGAYEYIAKPFSYEVFIARLNALLRKTKKEQLSNLVIGDIEINKATQRVKVREIDVELNRKEYKLMNYLIKNKNRVLTREQLLTDVEQAADFVK
ncbi:MAG: response regulator transcription factor, partial [Eubacteriales bacterium]